MTIPLILAAARRRCLGATLAGDVARVIAAAFEKEAVMSLKGKHALVTGGSRGIGRGTALKLAEDGARVAVHYYANKAAATPGG